MSSDPFLELYRAMIFPRLIEERMTVLLRQGRLSKWFSGIGQEAISAGVVCSLRKDDTIVPGHRNLGVFAARVNLLRLLRQLLGRDGGFTKGRDRTFHFGALQDHIVGMISHLGAMLPVADGLALAETLNGTDRVVVAFTGDGASSEGDFHEAVNLAAVWKLPVIFVIENNQFSLSTPVSEQFAAKSLADRAAGYGIPGITADGNDVLAVSRVVSEAVSRARHGDGPTLIEFSTFRMRGHEEASGTKFVRPELYEEWKPKDPIARLERLLVTNGVLDKVGQNSLRRTLKNEIETAVEEVLSSPEPSSTAERELDDVFAPLANSLFIPRAASAAVPADDVEMRYVDAVRDGLREAMRQNARVILLGQDIAEYGGVFKVTEGFVAEFGKERVRNTPTIESGALGAALGLALGGYLPMVEMQFGDFLSCGFNQIVNNIAKTHYRWGAAVPMVIRAPIGGGLGAGPFHSQNVEAWFAGVAGLKIVAPATAYDAKGLLLAAFEDGNPILYLEHKFLYRSIRERVPVGRYLVPIGRARIARTGNDATIVTYGVGVLWALETAAQLALEGVEIEVIDLRSLIPWDVEAVLESVRRTNRALVLHEAPTTGGFGGEIAATIAQSAFSWLDAPVGRLGALNTPVPFAKPLEEIFSPKGRLLACIRELLAY
jgi:2-oxoisovalerate dehydrogenase E1 component